MSMESALAALDAWLWLAREGGLVAAPALAGARRIELGRCAEPERRRIAALINDCRAHHGSDSNAPDQRFYRLVLGRGADTELEELRVPEASAPQALVALWQHGRLPDGSSVIFRGPAGTTR